MNVQILAAVALATVVFFTMFQWWSGKRYGKLLPDKEVTEAYDSFTVYPETDYFISGSEVYPNAVIGISRAWTLETDLWKKKNLDPQGMRELVQNMRNKTQEEQLTLHGFVILDDHGIKIGTWFSIMGISTVVEIVGERRVVISTPPLNTHPSS